MFCPWCGVKNDDDLIFCNDCGKKLPQSYLNDEAEKDASKRWKCHNCEIEYLAEFKFCPKCGKKKKSISGRQNIQEEPSTKTSTDDSGIGLTAFKCIIVFFCSIGVGILLKPGDAIYSSIPGIISFGLIMTHKDSKVPLFICFFIGLVIGCIASGKW